MGFRDIGIASSSVHPVHAEIIPAHPQGRRHALRDRRQRPHRRAGQPGARSTSRSSSAATAGARASLVTDEVPVDVAFIAAPCCDETGNLNGVSGPSACGSLGYAFTDARYARKVVAVTDNLVPYPASPVSISQSDVDYVVGDRLARRPEEDRLDDDPRDARPGRPADRPLRGGGHRGGGPAAGRLLVPDRRRAARRSPSPTRSSGRCWRRRSRAASAAAASPATSWTCSRKATSGRCSTCSASTCARSSRSAGT